jgi:hypothetical protein
MLFPDYFRDRAKKCLELAKKMRKSQLAQTLSKRTKLWTQTAMEVERSFGWFKGANKPSPDVFISQAKTLDDLKRELKELPDGSSLCIPLIEYSPDQRNEFWRASPHLSRQFRCTGEFRPDGGLWFVKRP